MKLKPSQVNLITARPDITTTAITQYEYILELCADTGGRAGKEGEKFGRRRDVTETRRGRLARFWPCRRWAQDESGPADKVGQLSTAAAGHWVQMDPQAASVSRQTSRWHWPNLCMEAWGPGGNRTRQCLSFRRRVQGSPVAGDQGHLAESREK